ncbi:formate dehydrogenase accessory sulfurtransferase FdhD [Haloferula helveola]
MDRGFSARSAEGKIKEERVAVEEPLQITLDGHPVAVVMRTPGHDADLVRGFLVTEGIVASPAVVRKIEHRDNHALVFLDDEADFDPASLRRNLFSASSCGICGKASIEGVFSHFEPLREIAPFSNSSLLGAPEKLRAAQPTFDVTGGLHAAALFDRAGQMLALREDVGRHNAVDKVIGHALAGELPMEDGFLMVSGRVSFEILQKALGARIPLVAAISAPSSLAIEFAGRSGQTLVAFLRPPKFNVYAGEVMWER